MFNYDQEEFTWTLSQDKKVIIGVSNKQFQDDIKFNSTNFMNAKTSGSHGKSYYLFMQ